jgi:predicted ATPase
MIDDWAEIGRGLDVKVYFCGDDIKHQPVRPSAIIFYPIDDGWNDFKYRCRYRYRVYFGERREGIEGHVFLGFVSDHEKIDRSGRISQKIDLVEADELPDFFTMQGGMGDYRRIVSEHGIEMSRRLLLAFNDLVVSKGVAKRTRLVNEAIKTKVFSLAFMRDAERFFSFHNAESVLNGLEEESFSKISTQLSLSYKLSGFPQNHNFRLDFETDSLLPKRICVLIGRNGLGKSQALNAIARSLILGDERFSDRGNGRPMISRLLAIATPGETGNTFPAERANRRIKYRRLMLNRSARAKPSRGFGDLCVQLARSEEPIGKNDRWSLFEESIQFFSNIDKVVLPLSKDLSVKGGHVSEIKGKLYVPLLSLRRGSEQTILEIQGAVVNNATPVFYIDGDIYPLSSGQLTFIKFIVQACLFVENGTLVLLDEPETHLHPNFISEFVRILNRLLRYTGSVAVIATHSAYFVREVPRGQVLVFKREVDGHVSIQNPRLKTFGADVGTISYFVFEDEITNGLVEDILERFPQAPEDRFFLLKELEEELSADVVMYLRRKLNMEQK